MGGDEPKIEPLPSAEDESPPTQTVATAVATTPPPLVSTPPAPVGVRIRPKLCDVRNCDSNSLRNPEILFVSVPGHSYPERRFVWLTLMQAVRDKKRSYCCSRHFKVPDDFKDFQEFISAPPGYKRQLLVKKGVVPHLNMPPLNMSALPPLTNRWQMTLPSGLTEAEKQQQNAGRSISHQLGLRNTLYPQYTFNSRSEILPVHSQLKTNKSVQTDSTVSTGPRMIAPSLQYCRLCFKRQDLEPIFTGDQTLIEPDLIDKIFRCTEVKISVENDFPSSICTGCYTNVHEFVKFRRLVQQNDQSLRGTTLPHLSKTQTPTRSPPQSRPQFSAVRAKTTETVPNRPTMKVTPVRPANSMTQAPRQEDSLLEVQRVENVEEYQRRQRIIERNQPLRVQRIQDTLYPIPYRRAIVQTPSTDPLANTEIPEKITAQETRTSSTQEGVHLSDRIVPVTLIRVQPETTEMNQDPDELHADKNSFNTAGESEDVTVKSEESVPRNPVMNIIRPKPLHQLMANPHQKMQNPPNVLQAVKLLPSEAAKALTNQKPHPKPVSTLTRGITSGRFVNKMWKPIVKSTVSKASSGRTVPKALARGIKFPGTLTTLFSGPRKHKRASSPNAAERPRSTTPELLPSTDQHKPSQTTEKPQVLIEMNPAHQTNSPSIALPPKTTSSVSQQSKQTENTVPDEPTELTPGMTPTPIAKFSTPKQISTPKPSDMPKSNLEATPPSPRSSRTRKVPLKFQDTVCFPMPKMITIKTEPDSKNVESPKDPLEHHKESPVRVTRRSQGVEEKSVPNGLLAKPEQKQSVPKKKQPKQDDAPKIDSSVLRPTRSSESVKKSDPQPKAKPIKRKSDINPNSIVQEGPTEPKSSKLESKRINLDTSGSKQQSKKLEERGTNGSQISIAKAAEAKQRKPKKAEPECPAPVSSQDWKCPFCPDKVFDQKKGLVKHLRKRHGMDYALVRQRLAIYGGNWR